MEYDEQDQNEGGFLSRLRESPRTVSVLIIILIVAAAIYAFSDNQDQEPVADTSETMEEAGAEDVDEGGTGEDETVEDATATPEAVAPEVLAEQNQALPAGERTSEGYVEVAQAGDGVTHLARRAATRYIAEQEVGYAVTNEHRIYIEDYIKDNLSKRGLALDESVTIPLELMQEAVTAAGELTPRQLQNLGQYTHVLS